MPSMQQLVVAPGNRNMTICGAVPANLPTFTETGTDGHDTFVTPINSSTPCSLVQDPLAAVSPGQAPLQAGAVPSSSSSSSSNAGVIGESFDAADWITQK